jgi:DNA primase
LPTCGLSSGKVEPKYLSQAEKQYGLWNGTAATACPDELIVTEEIFDGLAFWQAGIKNVVAVYGKEGKTSIHAAFFQKQSVRKVILAFNNNPAAEERSKKLAPELTAPGVKVHRSH